MTRNPHAGEPFTDDDATIAAALEDVSVPALLCSLVHMTGDPSWIRGDIRPRIATLDDYQGGIPADEQAEVRRRALPAIAAYRDAGCAPHDLSRDVLLEMMAFLALPAGRGPPRADVLRGPAVRRRRQPRDRRGATRSPTTCKAASPVVVDRLRRVGHPRGHPPRRRPGCRSRSSRRTAGPGGTWWENRYPGARVDVGSHQYCYSFEPADHWSEYFCQQPELRDYFASIVEKYELRPHCRFDTAVTALTWDEATASCGGSTSRAPTATTEVLDARFVISAVGSLNIPQLPDIPGMDDFAGPSFHSARWPDDLDLAGTRFALDRRRRERLPDRARRSPTTSSSSRSTSAPRSGCSRTRSTTRRCRTVTAGRCGTCRSTGAGSASS